MTFERFTVVRVPFPFTDSNASKNRPALVLSDSTPRFVRGELGRLSDADQQVMRAGLVRLFGAE